MSSLYQENLIPAKAWILTKLFSLWWSRKTIWTNLANSSGREWNLWSCNWSNSPVLRPTIRINLKWSNGVLHLLMTLMRRSGQCSCGATTADRISYRSIFRLSYPCRLSSSQSMSNIIQLIVIDCLANVLDSSLRIGRILILQLEINKMNFK